MMKIPRIALLPVLACLLCCCACSKSDPWPSDQALIDRFTSNEPSFTALSQNPQDSELRSRLGIIDSFSFSEKAKAHTFIVWRKDLVGPGGYSKGYYYSQAKPSGLVDSIDVIYDAAPAEQREAYMPIKGPWYLYYSASN